MASAPHSVRAITARLLIALLVISALILAAAILPGVVPGLAPAGPQGVQTQLLTLTVTVNASPGTIDVGQTVSFTCSASGGVAPYTYSWTFGDGASGSGASVTHAYTTVGSMVATCNAADTLVDTGSASTTIIVNPLPSVKASASPSSAVVGATITFTTQASGGSGTYASFAWSFGDGSTGSGSSTTHAYASPSTHTASVTVTDSTGATASASTGVTIVSSISVQASADHTAAAPGTSITFSAQAAGGSGSYSSYAWALGDLSTGSGAQVTHAYMSAGTYTAQVTVTDSLGDTGSGSVTVAITAIAVTGGVSPSSGPVGTTFTFTASATGGNGSPYTYAWNFGDGSTGTGSSVSHAYTSKGNYTPTVVATDPLGGTGTSSLQTVAVTTSILPLSVSAQASPPAVDVGQSVVFTCNATGGLPPYSYSWTFGDGGSATGFSVSHVYVSAGSNTATCSVSDVLSDHASSSVAVVVSPAPAVQAGADYHAAAPGSQITFSAQASGGTGNFVSYAWDFGDGTKGSGAQVTHAYSAPGSYAASVVVTDSNGGSAISSVSVNVSFVAMNAYVSSTAGSPGSAFNFTAFASGGAGAPYVYTWAFGDGATATGDIVTHAYAATGNYTPSVRATDPLGAGNLTALPTIDVVSTTWVPGGPLNVSILVSVKYPLANESLTFQALGHGGAGTPTCTWSYGDSNSSTGCSSSHAWKAPGNYTVTVTVRDSTGNVTSSATRVAVEPALLASFVLDPTPIAGEPTTLQAQITGGSGTYNCTWNFGDTNQSAGCAVSHTWPAQGQYTIDLTVLDSQGHRVEYHSPQYVPAAPQSVSAGGAIPLLIAAGLLVALGIAYAAWRRRSRQPLVGETKELDQYLTDLERFTQAGGAGKAALPPLDRPEAAKRDLDSRRSGLRSAVSDMAASWTSSLRSFGTHLLQDEPQEKAQGPRAPTTPGEPCRPRGRAPPPPEH